MVEGDWYFQCYPRTLPWILVFVCVDWKCTHSRNIEWVCKYDIWLSWNFQLTPITVGLKKSKIWWHCSWAAPYRLLWFTLHYAMLNAMWTYFRLFFKSIIEVHKVQVVGCRSVRCVVKCAVHVTRVNRWGEHVMCAAHGHWTSANRLNEHVKENVCLQK